MDAATLLSDNDVLPSEETFDLLVALARTDVITDEEHMALAAKHIRERKLDDL